MTEAYRQCEQRFVAVVRAMQEALVEASGARAPPLPPLVQWPAAVSSGGIGPRPAAGLAVNSAVSDTDTAVQRRARWEATMKERLRPLARQVQDACADLHDAVGCLSEFCTDPERCRAAQASLVAETALLEERLVRVYSGAAREEERLMKALLDQAAGSTGNGSGFADAATTRTTTADDEPRGVR